VAVFLAWTLLGVLAYGRNYLHDNRLSQGSTVFELLDWLTCFYPWVLFTGLIFRLEQRLPLGSPRWPRNLLLLALAGVPLSYVATQLMLVLSLFLHQAFHQPASSHALGWLVPVREFIVEHALYWSTVLAAYVIRNLAQLREQERAAAQFALEKSQLESSLRRAELEILRMRLNPHFLFNSLQNISSLAQQDPKTASQMLTRLGDLLRLALRPEAAPETTLKTEIEVTQAYVSVEKMRFGDRLSVMIDLGPGTQQAAVPTFLLQPLVENAIKHGLRGSQTGIIVIKSTKQSEQLILTVIDNGAGVPHTNLSEMEMGVGLGSVSERLQRMYPGQHALVLDKLPEGGTQICVTLPYKLKSSELESTTDDQPSSVNR
jgi:two-component system, LytTR family, sensor kinase